MGLLECIQSYNTVTDLYNGLKQYFIFYNQERLHETLDYQTPESKYKMAA